MKLEVKNLSFSYGNAEILKDINFSAKSGEFIGILGPNGCGKSTLVKNIMKIYKPNKGEILLEDKKINDYSRKELAKIIGFVPQKSAISMPLSVRDVVLMGRYPHLKSSFIGYEKADFKAVDEILQKLGIWEFKHRLIFSLSGGEFQKVILARALVSEPKILLLDEPTSALDLNFSITMLKICKELIRDLKMISLIVIHDLNLASLICDKVFMLKDGKIIYDGSPRELFTKEILKDIYSLDCEVINHENRAVIVAN